MSTDFRNFTRKYSKITDPELKVIDFDTFSKIKPKIQKNVMTKLFGEAVF